MAKIIMTADEYVTKLKYLLTVPTAYNNNYPCNVGYVHANKVKSFDCWNLIKCLLNGYDVTCNQTGYYQHDLSNTGDVTGSGLMKQCTEVSSDFSLLTDNVPRHIYLPGHSGSYVGEFQMNGRTYNVIECTGSWTHNVLASWVDKDGTRRQYKGGPRNDRWRQHGKMTKWLDYYQIPKPQPTPEPTPEPIPQPTPIKVDPAQSFDKKKAGTYEVTASSLNMRSGAGTNKAILCVLPKGTKVQNYGYYTKKWLYVKYKDQVGYCYSQYLKHL